jgi:hypothetical protein
LRALRTVAVTAHSWASGLWMYWIVALASFTFAGWVVGRTHRQHGTAMVLAFMCYAVRFAYCWNPDGLERCFVDAASTCAGFGTIVLGGLLPAWHGECDDSY